MEADTSSAQSRASRERAYKNLARRIRLLTLRMTNEAGSSHVGSSFSMAEILAVLYSGVLKVDPTRPEWAERDRFVLSKGHGCAGLYAVLAEQGFFPAQWLDSFYKDGGRLHGHATHRGIPGVEVSTGSLGHGLSIACGMALAGKRSAPRFRVIVLLSDGECDEGSTWEAAMLAGHHDLGNLTAIVDYNKIQSLGHVKDVLDLEPFENKWQSFGWKVKQIDGHDVIQVEDALNAATSTDGKPKCIIANTIKGKGVSFMEDKLLWHYRSPQGEEFTQALAELEKST